MRLKRTFCHVDITQEDLKALFKGHSRLGNTTTLASFTKQITSGVGIGTESIISWLLGSELGEGNELNTEMAEFITQQCPRRASVVMSLVRDDPPEEDIADEVHDEPPPIAEVGQRVIDVLIESTYPHIHKLGVIVWDLGSCYTLESVNLDKELTRVDEAMPGFKDTFHKYMGIQTRTIYGPYPWDVEAVLERIASGKLVGTQSLWD